MRNLNGKLDHVVPGDKSFDFDLTLLLIQAKKIYILLREITKNRINIILIYIS